MIKIKRDKCPLRLSKGYKLSNEGCKSEVVETLHQMQYGKCCYCERKINKTGHDQAIEHYKPKSEFPELENTWENLLQACSCCNGDKLAKFPTDENGLPLLIDPSESNINPEDHFEFDLNDEDNLVFGRIKQKNKSRRGQITIEAIGLDKPNRRCIRVSIYKDLYTAYIDIIRASDDTTRQQKVKSFDSLLAPNSEFAAFARAFARYKKLDSRFGVTIPNGLET